MDFVIKRVYEAPDAADGKRVLVDRLWPRGLSRNKAALDAWLKEAGPSSALRSWFGHQPERFAEFARRYRQELDSQPEMQSAVQLLLEMGQKGRVTLLYGARDPHANQAAVLAAYLAEYAARSGASGNT